jgi:tetratricopeptide (TPR) repeat protein
MMPDPTAATDDCASEPRFEELLEKGRLEVGSERLGDALRSFEKAERIAELENDRLAADRAWLNRCAVLIAMQRTEELSLEVLHRMRLILMAGDDAVNCRLAAYNMAKVYELTKQYRKGLFYAQIALERSRNLDSREWLASSHNQLGLLLLATSRFEEAREAFRTALELLPAAETSIRRAAIEDNLGYTCIVLGERREGFLLLTSSIRSLLKLGCRRERIFPHLRLCFAHIELGRPAHAIRHGLRALSLAEEFGEPVSTQYSLYLLGEAAQLAGDAEQARVHFQRLQQRYFPDNPSLPDVLLTVDVRNLVNLRA